MKYQIDEELYFTVNTRSIELACTFDGTDEFLCKSTDMLTSYYDYSLIHILKHKPTLVINRPDIILGRALSDLYLLLKEENNMNLLEIIGQNTETREKFLDWYNFLLQKFNYEPITLATLEEVLSYKPALPTQQEIEIDNWVDENTNTLHLVFEKSAIFKVPLSYNRDSMIVSLLSQMNYLLLQTHQSYSLQYRNNYLSKYFNTFKDLITSYQATYIKEQLDSSLPTLLEIEEGVSVSEKMSIDNLVEILNDRDIVTTNTDDEGKVYIEISPIYLYTYFSVTGLKKLFQAFDYIKVTGTPHKITINPKDSKSPVKRVVQWHEYLDFIQIKPQKTTSENVRIRKLSDSLVVQTNISC